SPAAVFAPPPPAPADPPSSPSRPAVTPPRGSPGVSSRSLPRDGGTGRDADAPAPAREEPEPARRGDQTVGDFSTVQASGDAVGLSWTEGMLVADRFRIVRCIGQGGMGMVYLAHDQSLDRPIALKRVPQEILFDGDARDDLRQEANRLLDLAHENIIRIH